MCQSAPGILAVPAYAALTWGWRVDHLKVFASEDAADAWFASTIRRAWRLSIRYERGRQLRRPLSAREARHNHPLYPWPCPSVPPVDRTTFPPSVREPPTVLDPSFRFAAA